MDLSLLSNLDIVHLIDTGGIIPALFIALLTYLVMRFTRFGFDRLGENYTRYRLNMKQASVLIQFLILLLGAFLCLLRFCVIICPPCFPA